MPKKREVRRYLKRVRRARSRRKRQTAVCLFLACFFYLLAVALAKEGTVSVREQEIIEYRASDGKSGAVWRAEFNLKTWELTVTREEEGPG